ncbi:MAG: hypothetical protein QM783_18400 [Phycisphaerales bacterium]
MGAFLKGLLLLDAIAVAGVCAAGTQMRSVVGSVLSFPLVMMQGRICHTGPLWEVLVAKKDSSGTWTVAPQLTEQEFYDTRIHWAETPQDPTVAHVLIRRRLDSGSFGLWTPVVFRDAGRRVRVVPSPAGLALGEETAIRASAMQAVAVMSAPGSKCAWSAAYSPWEQREIDAALAGGSPTVYRVMPLGVANECAVGAGIVLLCAGHPRRDRRRQAAKAARALRELAPRTQCRACGYALAGLPSDAYGERVCPECGKPNGESF